jgi:hypothetical protein
MGFFFLHTFFITFINFPSAVEMSRSIQKFQHHIIQLLKILAFVAKNNYHGINQKRENRFLTNQEAAAIILAQ